MPSLAAYFIVVQWGRFFRHLGGPGLILLGVLGPVIPLPGGLEALTIVLAARHRELWLYYAGMATLGAILGGQLTYEVARRGRTQTLERRLRPEAVARLFRQFERWAFGTVFVSGFVPPPVPIFPVFLAAGALQYSRKKFFLSLTLGRAIRYFAIALLAAIYGRRVFSHLVQSRTLLVMICVAAAVFMAVILVWVRRRWLQPADRVAPAISVKRDVR